MYFLNSWITDEGYNNAPMPKLKVITKVSKWSKYECMEHNGIKYIRGYGNKLDSELFEYKEVKNATVLFALMDVANKLNTVMDNNHSYVNENIVESDIDIIIGFCRSYGLPFWSSHYTVDCYANEGYPNFEGIEHNEECNPVLMRSIIPFASYNIMPVASFIIGVYRLQTDFLRVALYNGWNNDINISELITNVPKNKTDIILNFLKRDGLHLFYPGCVSFNTYWDTTSLALGLNCENLFHLSIYYLCLLAQTSEYTGGYIRKCKKCDNLFVAKNSRQQFCGTPCTRQSYYSMKKRIEI